MREQGTLNVELSLFPLMVPVYTRKLRPDREICAPLGEKSRSRAWYEEVMNGMKRIKKRNGAERNEKIRNKLENPMEDSR